MTSDEKNIIDAIIDVFESKLTYHDYTILEERSYKGRKRYHELKESLILAVDVVRPIVAPKCHEWAEDIADAIIKLIVEDN